MLSSRSDIPENLLARHKCQSKSCVNHDHLELGTDQDNSNDAAIRDKTLPMGEKHYLSKISDETAIKIFWSKLDGLTQQERAEKFGVSKSIVKEIDSGRSRRHLFSDDDRLKVHGEKKVRELTQITQDLYNQIKNYQKAGTSIQQCAKLMKIGSKRIRSIYHDRYKISKNTRKTTEQKWYDVKISESEIKTEMSRIKKKIKSIG